MITDTNDFYKKLEWLKIKSLIVHGNNIEPGLPRNVALANGYVYKQDFAGDDEHYISDENSDLINIVDEIDRVVSVNHKEIL